MIVPTLNRRKTKRGVGESDAGKKVSFRKEVFKAA